MDEAAEVFADPITYIDKPKFDAPLGHWRSHAPVSRVRVRRAHELLDRRDDTTVRGVPIARGARAAVLCIGQPR